MDNEKAAKALKACGYCSDYICNKFDDYALVRGRGERCCPSFYPKQMLALLQFFLSFDKSLTLSGDGHLSVEEQMLNYIDECLSGWEG